MILIRLREDNNPTVILEQAVHHGGIKVWPPSEAGRIISAFERRNLEEESSIKGRWLGEYGDDEGVRARHQRGVRKASATRGRPKKGRQYMAETIPIASVNQALNDLPERQKSQGYHAQYLRAIRARKFPAHEFVKQTHCGDCLRVYRKEWVREKRQAGG